MQRSEITAQLWARIQPQLQAFLSGAFNQSPTGTTNYRIGRHRTASDLWAQKMRVNWGSRQA